MAISYNGISFFSPVVKSPTEKNERNYLDDNRMRSDKLAEVTDFFQRSGSERTQFSAD